MTRVPSGPTSTTRATHWASAAVLVAHRSACIGPVSVTGSSSSGPSSAVAPRFARWSAASLGSLAGMASCVIDRLPVTSA